MNVEISKDYKDSIAFWDSVFTLSAEDQEEALKEVNAEEDWLQLAPSEKLLNAIVTLGKKEKVLDYGCGHGWASIIAAKSGCPDVTGVEVVENGVSMSSFYTRLFDVKKQVHIKFVSPNWISKEEAGKYDGFFCSNVIDVVPVDIADFIIREAARIVTADASVIISMNYYQVPQENPEHKVTVKEGNHIYVDGILRMVSRTDEEWSRIFEQYFTVESIDHFAWAGEETETRRIFYLKKK